MKPRDPDYEAQLAADIARLQSAKGIQIAAWLRENRTLCLILLAYAAVVGSYVFITWIIGAPVGLGVILGVIFGPFVLLRMYTRWKRR